MNDILTLPTHVLVVNSHGSVGSDDIKGALYDIYGLELDMVDHILDELFRNDTAEVFSGTFEECEAAKTAFFENNVPVYHKEI